MKTLLNPVNCAEFCFVFGVVYFVYYITGFPSVPGGDSGELLAEACVSIPFYFKTCST
jgi:hypothetical protein